MMKIANQIQIWHAVTKAGNLITKAANTEQNGLYK
jgi:hypothetical protein